MGETQTGIRQDKSNSQMQELLKLVADLRTQNLRTQQRISDLENMIAIAYKEVFDSIPEVSKVESKF